MIHSIYLQLRSKKTDKNKYTNTLFPGGEARTGSSSESAPPWDIYGILVYMCIGYLCIEIKALILKWQSKAYAAEEKLSRLEKSAEVAKLLEPFMEPGKIEKAAKKIGEQFYFYTSYKASR